MEKKTEEKQAPKVKASKEDIAGARVRVYGKAQNRTALGIMHAYMVMYPQAKLEDIRKAFPDSLNPDSGVKKNFVYAEDKGTTADWNGFFKAEDELLKMGDGKKVSVVSMWTKDSFERLVAWAKQYGIVVADFEKAAGGGQKGGFRLEYLNGYVPPKQKKGIAWWVWVLVVAVIALLCLLLFGKKKAEPQVSEVEKVAEVEKVVVVHDTLFVKQIAEIEDHYNAATFIVGKADLSEEAKFVLHDLAKVMKDYPEIKLRLEGHTSAEGEAAFNQRLSEARAQAAVDFMVNHEGVDASRLEAVGKGSSEPKNPDDPKAPENRRTEFIVLD
ncbi:MAG: OmpA family protein [Bacteroidales bacterium]|nr:OmpA family protein [Bacteroidales bacterium]